MSHSVDSPVGPEIEEGTTDVPLSEPDQDLTEGSLGFHLVPLHPMNPQGVDPSVPRLFVSDNVSHSGRESPSSVFSSEGD